MSRPDGVVDTTLRRQLMAMLRDVLTISAVFSVLCTAIWWVVRPYATPFLTLPAEVAQINAMLTPFAKPQLVEFNGIALVAGPRELRRGQPLRLIYNLRRNASCRTDVETSFIDVDTGSRITTSVDRAVQAPVTDEFSSFLLTVIVPNNLPDGNWIYYPRIVPVDCGIYRAYNAVMSEVFTVSGSI